MTTLHNVMPLIEKDTGAKTGKVRIKGLASGFGPQ